MKKNNRMLLTTGVHSIAALVITLVPFTTTSAETGQQVASRAMADICQNSQELFGYAPAFACTGNNNPLAGPQSSPEAAINAETISITSPYQFIRSVNQQAQKLRDCESSESQQGNTKKRNPECRGSGGGSSSDAYGFIGPFGVSFSGGGGFGDRNTTAAQTGLKIDTRQANLTLDYSFAKGLIGGFAFNYVNADRTLDLASGTLNSDSYRFAPFLSYTPTPNSYITLMGGYARVDFDSTRKVATLQDAKANYSANEYFASLGAGYTWRLDAWSLRGYGRGDYNHLNIGSFQESGGLDTKDNTSYTSTVNGQSVLSVISTLGVELSYAISTNTLAAVVIPKVHAEWAHEFKNNSRPLATTFTATSTNGKSYIAGSSPASTIIPPIAVAGPERNWANLGFGVQMLFPHAIVGFVNYDYLLIENASNQTITGGLRVSF